jgi:hypothetical protein
VEAGGGKSRAVTVGSADGVTDERGDLSRCDDLPHMFETHGFPARASALRALIEEVAALQVEVAERRAEQQRMSATGPWTPLTFEQQCQVRAELEKYGQHLSSCSVGHEPERCSCGFEDELGRWPKT